MTRRPLTTVVGAAGYVAALAAIAGMALRVRLGRALDRALEPVDSQANRCWGEG